MRRLWLLVAALLSLLPAPAAAGERVPASRGEQYMGAAGHDLGDQVRGGIGFEIPTQQGRGDARSPRSICPDPEVPEALGFHPAPSSVRDEALPAPEGSTPLCEHLPYHATAPPHGG